MDFITDEFIFARTGEPLEERLQENDKFRQQMKLLRELSKAFAKDSGLSEKSWKLFNKLEDEWSKYNIMYGEESYRLGFEDGVQIASERKIRARGSVLSFKDMTHLICMYDAVKKLNELLLGTWEILDREGGILAELDRVCDVIVGGACAEIRLCGEEDAYECLTDIMDNPELTPEERAKKLTGVESI